MPIKKNHLNDLQNEEHAKFMNETDDLLTQADPVKVKVAAEYAAFKPLLADERAALDVILKSSFTAQIDEADAALDRTISGLYSMVNGMLNHFDPAINHAAHNVKVVTDNFSGITDLSNKKEGAATESLLLQLKGTFAADIALMGLTSWVAEIEAKETAFNALDSGRLDEKDGRTRLRMKQVRVNVDAAYNGIVNKINALIIVEGETNYVSLVNKLNLRIDSYTNVIAQRKGIAAVAKAAKKPPTV